MERLQFGRLARWLVGDLLRLHRLPGLMSPVQRASARLASRRRLPVHPAARLGDDDAAEVLRLSRLYGTEGADLPFACEHKVAVAGADNRHTLSVDIEPGARPCVRYGYLHLTGEGRALLLQSLGYLHHALQRGLAPGGERPGRAVPHRVLVDVGDLATSAGSVGFDRARGNTAVNLIPDIFFYMEHGYEQVRRIAPRWDARRARFVWRGSTTGAGELDRHSIPGLPRYRLCVAARRFGRRIDAGFTKVVQARSDEEAAALQALLVSQGLWRRHVGYGELARHRYILDIDGNAGSWSLLKKLATGSCVVKVGSSHEQWFDAALTPWVHYVPVAQDLGDFDDVVGWCLQNEDRCRVIGEAGRAFALERDFDSQMALAASTLLAAAAPRP